MLQERWNDLSICSIEKDILDDINLDIVFEDFASRNAQRRVSLQRTETLYFYLR